MALGAGLLAAGLAASGAWAGELYRFVDAQGVVHFTDAPTDGRFEEIRVRSRARAPSVPRSRTYDPIISRAANRHRVPAALVKAVVAAESHFDPRAVSPKGAMGLMQLMPATATRLGVAKPFKAAQNVDGGARYLRNLHDRYGDWFRTLAAYNAGPAAVDRHGGIPPYRETREYVDRVLTYYRRYHGDFPR